MPEVSARGRYALGSREEGNVGGLYGMGEGHVSASRYDG